MSGVPEWVKPGTRVVCFSTGGAGVDPVARTATITKVGKMWFSVDHPAEPRYLIDRQRANIGGTWGETRYAVPADSDTGRRQLDAQRRRNSAARAAKAVRSWLMLQNRRTREAAIAALQAVEDEEV